jgi:hypothetical protein
MIHTYIQVHTYMLLVDISIEQCLLRPIFNYVYLCKYVALLGA